MTAFDPEAPDFDDHPYDPPEPQLDVERAQPWPGVLVHGGCTFPEHQPGAHWCPMCAPL